MNNGKITAKQYRFCQEYVSDLNATQAVIKAGYSKKAAKEQGSRLLANVRVAKEIARLQKAVAERAEVRATDVLLELKKIAFSNLLEYLEYDASGRITLKASAELTPELTAAIGEVKQRYDSQGNVRSMDFKLHDKLAALDKLARHLKLFEGDSNKNGNAGFRIENFGPTLILAGPREQFVDDGAKGEAD